MTTQEQNLTPEQKELVAVGASIGAGCQPCVRHHLQAGRAAGLDEVQLLSAVTTAERVRAEATVAMADYVRRTLGLDLTSPAPLPPLEETLASLGAALGANDIKNIERQLRVAVELGASRPQLQHAIGTAHSIQENATRIHLREAQRLLDAVAPAIAAEESTPNADDRCGCNADNGTAESTHATKRPEPVTATRGQAPGCSGMTARFVAAGASDARAGCREMFERLMTSAATAETSTPPAATGATGP